MKNIFKQHKKLIIASFIVILLVAGFFDLKFEGLFFQLLPDSIQTYISDLL